VSHARESIAIGGGDRLSLLGEFVGVHEETLAFVGSFEFVGGSLGRDSEEFVEGFAIVSAVGGEEGAAAAEEEGDVEPHCRMARMILSLLLSMVHTTRQSAPPVPLVMDD